MAAQGSISEFWNLSAIQVEKEKDDEGRERGKRRRLISGVWTVNSPQSHIVRVYDAVHGKSGVFHSAEWHDGDWSSDGIREAWLWFFIWVESFLSFFWLG
ncbi:hypothetical protein TNCV_258861 [Trichonephila clavipes]|uniref:Uncharacterized protein n=1 Tax=Trichonephila clavipes TaxID=2585209 RepID=A0A8X6RVV7_TRICX|nr:hypothetical protein TNCV_258861 [Trichonephila clavipes]